MRIEQIEISNYGPFFVPATLVLELDVTVLTGPNDVGKSSVLRLISRLCQPDGQSATNESEFNYDRMFDASKTDWQDREDFGATFHTTLPKKRDGEYREGPLTPGARAIVHVTLGPRNRKRRV